MVINRLNDGSPASRAGDHGRVRRTGTVLGRERRSVHHATGCLDDHQHVEPASERGEGESSGVAWSGTDSAVDWTSSPDPLWVTTGSGTSDRAFRPVYESAAETRSEWVVPTSGVLLLSGASARREAAVLDTVDGAVDADLEEVLDLIADEVTSTWWS